ncbi:Scarecrow-like transcription factor pat1 [Thalictrum thalictroides]|uniref:DELLA protein n=1 Tax=Thalictrum thalictroides TaxID=46969 RepID=A0A7J6WFG4_THATH|nr:Scarecrow-like transcription factor pat1 [Thalictrum thalictroides]
MMTPYSSGISNDGCSSSSSSSCVTGKPSEIDGFLAGAGYKVKSSQLRQVAQRLERLENVMVSNNNASDDVSKLGSDVVHYNPSDLACWVDSMLSEFNNQPILPTPSENLSDFSDLSYITNTVVPLPSPQIHPMADTWNNLNHNHDQFTPSQGESQPLTTVVAAIEEDSGIRLVHLLMACAESVQRGDVSLAGSIIGEMKSLLTRVNTGSGIGKVAGYFIDALSRRLYSPQAICAGSAMENEILYHHFYEACPYLKFAHFTANQAILEAFEGQDYVHVIDFNLMHGLQWPALIQALALRPGGPPSLRLTGIGPPSPDGRDSLREIGLRLAELAWSVNVPFSFRGVAASRLDDVKPWMLLPVDPIEAVAVNSIMQLHRILGPDPIRGGSPIDTVLSWIRSLNPKIVTVIEQEANHNQPEFLDRFTEALYYYSTMFDSLEASTTLQPEKSVAEIYIQKEICNVVCCEGTGRVERHEPLIKWRERLTRAGFNPLHLGSNAFKQASMLLTLFSAEGYCVEEKEGCLTLGWHNRPLISASAWHALPELSSAPAASLQQ